MIPVEVMNKDGELSYQVFNDNMTAAEQINRKLLGVIYNSQLVLTNDLSAYLKKLGNNGYTAAELDTINAAASALDAAVKTAIATFEATIA